jgi:hypothetical protein
MALPPPIPRARWTLSFTILYIHYTINMADDPSKVSSPNPPLTTGCGRRLYCYGDSPPEAIVSRIVDGADPDLIA